MRDSTKLRVFFRTLEISETGHDVRVKLNSYSCCEGQLIISESPKWNAKVDHGNRFSSIK